MLSADDTAIYNAYNDGSLQFIDTVPNDEIANVILNDDFFIVPNLGTYYVAFNVNSPLFEGKTPEQAAAMREAFSILIDRQYIVDAVGQTGQQPAGTFIPAGMADGQGGVFAENDDDYEYPVTWDFDGEEAVGYYDPTQTGAGNVEEAIALLEEAHFNEVWLVGSEFQKANSSFRTFANVDEVKATIAQQQPTGRYILIKGSNSTKLFQLPELL
jgi:peptide/nickel transport system substrate-binding protein/oligopeptide transport system substrate-binding protein